MSLFSSNSFSILDEELTSSDEEKEEKPVDFASMFAGVDFEAFDFSILNEIPVDESPTNLHETEANFSEQDILNVFKQVSRGDPLPQRDIPTPPINVAPRIVKTHAHGRKLDRLLLCCKNGVVYFENNGLDNVIIGRCKDDSRFSVLMERKHNVDSLHLLQEEVAGKGMNLGFSNLLHSYAVLVLSSVGMSVMEPLTGGDVDLDVNSKHELFCRVEITGENYMIRKTSCALVINKYALLDAYDDSPEYERIRDLCRKEEDGDHTMFDGSSIDIGPSPYSGSLRSILNSIYKMTKEHADKMVPYVMRWYRDYECPPIPEDEDPDPTIFERIKRDGLKVSYEGSLRAPSPYKCTPNPQPDLYERTVRNIHYNASELTWEKGTSTYHTWDPNVMYNYQEKMTFRVPPRDESCTVPALLQGVLLKNRLLACIEAESSLIQSIEGKLGTYWSDRHQLGIRWESIGKSLMYNVNYFSHDEPDDMNGKWHTKVVTVPMGNSSTKRSVHLSPSFVVSRQDISYASCEWPRVATVFVSIFNLMGNNMTKYHEIFESFVDLWGVCHNSTFLTSSLAGDQRFFTTRGLTGFSFGSLINRVPEFKKKLRNCDFHYIKLVERLITDPPKTKKSPVFRFPYRFASLEKDIGVLMNWHNRKCDHETECCRKILKGALDEISNRDRTLRWYEKQAIFMKNLVSNGVTYDDFKTLMDSCPDNPAMCIPFMSVMIHLCEEDIDKAAKSQTSTNFRLVKLFSDRGSTKETKSGYSATKVVDALSSLIHKYNAKSAYDLMVKLLASNENMSEVFAGSSKDGRGYREISTQKITRRIFQAFTEEMSSTISMALPDDALKDREKYTPMVNNFLRIMRNRSNVVCTSEDRSFHCGNNHPEALSSIALLIKTLAGVNSMTTVSAIQKHQTSREFILPSGFDDTDALEGVPKRVVMRSRNGKQTNTHAIKLFYHMMQGMQSTFVGVVNTIQSTGMMKLCALVYGDDIYKEDPYIITTSDDVGKGVAFSERFNFEELKREVIIKPLMLLKLSSQINNWRKFVMVEEEAFVEVNNIGVSDKGMLPQTPVHAALIVQPLNGLSPLQDVMNCVNNARSTIFYGDPPNVAWTAFETMLHVMQRKWNIKNSEIRALQTLELLPTNMEKLILGFNASNKRVISAMLSCTPEDQRHKVLTGERSLWQSILRKIGPKIGREDNEDQERIVSTLHLDGCRRVAQGIYNSRLIAGRLRAAYARPQILSKRRERTSEMMKLLSQSDFDDEEFIDKVWKVVRPLQVRIGYKVMMSQHFKPMKIGTVSKLHQPDRKRIECMRRFGIKYRSAMSEEELAISAIEDDDVYSNKMNELSHMKKAHGWSVPAPGGAPPIMYNERHIFTKPHIPFYTMEEVQKADIGFRNFTYRGLEVEDFNVCLWGDVSLRKAQNALIGFGVGMLEGEKNVFYKRKNGTIKCARIKEEQKLGFVRNGRDYICYITIMDMSPISHKAFCADSDSLFMYGDHVAMANYGNYPHSNSQSAMSAMNVVYGDKGSSIPHFVKNYLKPYPWFVEGAIEFPVGESTMVMGHKCIKKLKFKNQITSDELVIDLNHDFPVRVYVKQEIDEFA
jgi:hypothetical protein